MKYLILALFFVGCNKMGSGSPNFEPPKHKIYSGKFSLTCEKVSRYLERCENKETVCYLQNDYRGGVTCRFK